jgi:hypothetical protein
MPTFPRALVLGTLLAVTAGPAISCSGSPGTTAAAPTALETPAEQDHDGGGPDESVPRGRFVDRFRTYGSDFDSAPTFAALTDRSALVVTARLDEIREGRTVGTSKTDDTRSEHLVTVFTVTKVLKGDHSGSRLFVEIPKADLAPAAEYDAAKPAAAEAVLYLTPVPDPGPGTPILDPRAGLDPGATAYRPTTPQGFLVVESGQVVHPLASGTPSSGMFEHESPSPTDLRSWLPTPLRALAG